jgi:hypothetical protein
MSVKSHIGSLPDETEFYKQFYGASIATLGSFNFNLTSSFGVMT